ncbi:serine/threonine protein kinase [Fusarium oxysporum f. sp. melonis 26406]|uniref:Serine/threonine protein kinase n=1 Tax=Fusarium oxysporum f. sp. melonis 26406 TaxID=1089452 RepID=X0A9U2_FUSOX|nr:serine/threonine protein kinase [Fusarium oxysporum f. sp. melonis 26406]
MQKQNGPSSNQQNQQNHESQRVPDLVRDSRLPTCFLPSGAMEYIEHGDLQNYLNKPFSEAHAKVIGSQLVEGLGPKNILVYHPGPHWTVVGTEGYVAPEVIGFIPDQSPSSSSDTFSYPFAVDIWALGEVLFRMIAQRAVFPGRDNLRNHVFNRHPFPVATLEETGASQDCCNFVTNCMAVDPKCRLRASKAATPPWMQISHPPSRSSGRSSPKTSVAVATNNSGLRDR